ncbi:Ferredoxin--NADP reductase, partial [Durusdinium trenchii]
ADGYYPFNEEISVDWIATEVVCMQKGQLPCSRPAMIEMWKRVIGRASNPTVQIDGYELLSDWAAYIVQLPFYTVNVMNSNSVFQQLFKNGWLADWADYNSSVFYGGSNRYGMGAGPDMSWCSGGLTYYADKYIMDPKKAKCRTWSPYSVAGWLPAAPDVIQGHLLEMMWTGESVINFPGTDYHILWRKSLLDPAMNWSSYVTTIDIAGELFGLSTLFLGVEFYSPNLRRPEFDTFFLWGTLSQFAVLMDSHNVTKGITPTTSASRMVSLQFPSLSR